MSSADPPPDTGRVTLPQVLALMAVWSAVIYGLTTAKPHAHTAQISLKGKAAVACGKPG